MFTSNDTPAEEFRKAWDLKAVINLDDIGHWPFLREAVGEADWSDRVMCCRYNPGPLKGGNAIIGKPEEAKYGLTREQLFACYAAMKEAGVRRFGLHAMVASNELDPDYIADTAKMLFSSRARSTRRSAPTSSSSTSAAGSESPTGPNSRRWTTSASATGSARRTRRWWPAAG